MSLEQALLNAMVELKRDEGVGLGLMFAYFAVISEISTLDHKENAKLIGIPNDLDMSDFPIDNDNPIHELLEKYPSKVKPLRTKVVLLSKEKTDDLSLILATFCGLNDKSFTSKHVLDVSCFHKEIIEGHIYDLSISFTDGVRIHECEQQI